jgi:hypothetical protein
MTLKQTLVALTILVPGLAFADLGDTLESARIKYGDPSATGHPHIWAYVHNLFRIWQTYDDKGICVIVEYCLVNNGPFTPGDCIDLDRNNMPAGLVLGNGPGWTIVKWPDTPSHRDTVSFQYTEGDTRYQVIVGQFRRDDSGGWYYSRMYLSSEGIEIIKTL